jgi:uncharacterized protein (DUF2141 family)
MLKSPTLVMIGMLLGGPAIAGDAAPIEIAVHGVQNSEGTLVCSLFDRSDVFPTQHALAVARVTAKVRKGEVSCAFEAVRPGVYAIAGFHDENSNGKLDMGLLGPKEGWFTSRDARATFTPPRFADAKFTHRGGVLTLKATMVY